MFIFFVQICSSIPTVLGRYFFHLEAASLKTTALISLGQRLSFNFNFNLEAGMKISTH